MFQMKKERHSRVVFLGTEVGLDLHLYELQTCVSDPCPYCLLNVLCVVSGAEVGLGSGHLNQITVQRALD